MLNAVGISTGTFAIGAYLLYSLAIIPAFIRQELHCAPCITCACAKGKATCSRIMICNVSKPIRFGLLQAVFENSFDKSADILQPDAVNYFRQFPLKGTKFASAMNVAKKSQADPAF